MAVIYLFLRSVRATIIPGVAVPLSLVATFGVMALLGYSLNNLTLMALTISTGFVVDDAIVMIENIARYIEEGEKPLEAALKGAKQIGFTIISLTVSLVAVLIPLLFMGGVIGRLFREFAVTLATAIVASALISLTLTAMMCAPHPEAGAARPTRARSRAAPSACFDWMVARLRSRADLGARRTGAPRCSRPSRPWWSPWSSALITPKGLFPQQDTGLLLGVTEAAPDVSFATMSERQRAVADVVMQRSRRRSGGVVHRRRRHQPDAQQRAPLDPLKPRAERNANAQQIMDRLSERGCQRSAASSSTCRRCRICRSRAASSRTQYQYTLEDADPAELAHLGAARARAPARSCPSCADVASDQQTGARFSVAGHRSRHGVAPGRHVAGDRRHALRRLRPAAGLDDLHAAQPLPRDPRGDARASSRTRRRSAASTCASASGDAGAARRVRALRADRRRRCRSRTRGSSPR